MKKLDFLFIFLWHKGLITIRVKLLYGPKGLSIFVYCLALNKRTKLFGHPVHSRFLIITYYMYVQDDTFNIVSYFTKWPSLPGHIVVVCIIIHNQKMLAASLLDVLL